MLTVAGIINAFGITIFLSPVKLYDSGISGTSMLLDQITPEYLSLSVFLLILNIPLFLFGLKKQGKLFTGYAIYTVAIYSLSAWLITDILPIDVSMASPLAGTDLLLCALFVVFFKPLGYVVCGAVLCFVIMVLIGKRNWLQMVLVSILVPLGMWLVFYKVLTVNIPMGPLQFLRDLVDMI